MSTNLNVLKSRHLIITLGGSVGQNFQTTTKTYFKINIYLLYRICSNLIS
jgi:hypothetical protein